MATTSESNLPPLKRGESVLHPTTTWKQESEKLTLTVALRGLQSISLRVTSKQLLFWTDREAKRYVLLLNFFDRIIPSKTTYNITKTGATIVLEKMKNEDWPRLIASSEKVPYIEPDINAEMDEEEFTFEMIRKKFPLPNAESQQYYDRNGLPPEMLGSDFENMDDEDDLKREIETDDEREMNSDSDYD